MAMQVRTAQKAHGSNLAERSTTVVEEEMGIYVSTDRHEFMSSIYS